MAYESLEVLAAPVTVMSVAILKMWRDSSRTRELAEDANRKIDRHEQECNQRHEEQAQVNAAVNACATEISAMRKTQIWVGDGIVGIASKLDVKLPERP